MIEWFVIVTMMVGDFRIAMAMADFPYATEADCEEAGAAARAIVGRQLRAFVKTLPIDKQPASSHRHFYRPF